MLTVHAPYSPFEKGLTSGNALASFEGLYVSFRDATGKVVLLSLVFVFLWPLVLVFGFWLKLQRRFFVRYMKEDVRFDSPEDYASFKKRYDKLVHLKPSLEKVNSYNTEKAPPVVRYTLRQMQKTCSTLLTFHGWLDSKLEDYNKQQFPSASKQVKFRSESSLWKNRNAAYQYWM